MSSYLRDRLEKRPLALNLVAMTSGFMVYFCMYAFRKPFAAGSYADLQFLETDVSLKTAFVICQIIGYALSKYLGVKICPEVTRENRALLLVGLITVSEVALVLFAILPQNAKVIAIFFNGLSLGMIWGLVVWYLEGRRTSEILLAVLSCSFIVSSGIVKDVGRAMISGVAPWGTETFLQIPPVPEFWMPAATGLLFLLPLIGSVWVLNQTPEPNELDILARSRRQTMTVAERLAFVQRFLPGLIMLVSAYVVLTAFRDFRDNYTVEVLEELGLTERAGAITSMEAPIAFIVLVTMGAIYFVGSNQRAMLLIFAVVGFGVATICIATWLRQREYLDGYWWMLLIGLGSYLAYVPYNSVLFDRLMASTRATGTAVFAIYIADALGYTGSVVVQLFNDMFLGELSHLQFLERLCYFTSGLGVIMISGGGAYFLSQAQGSVEIDEPDSISPGDVAELTARI